MNAEEYEAYVAELVSQLDVFSSAKIVRNRQFDGLRQPGKYEIDISIEFVLNNALRFLLIIECKNWNRPVDRPIVQKLIQTRDAVSAHKAALVSPVGFTKEAIKVAEVQGIALWVIAEKVWQAISHIMRTRRTRITFNELRLSCLKYIMGYSPQKKRACTLIQQSESGSLWTNLPNGSRIRMGFGGLSSRTFETHLPRKLSFEIPAYAYGITTEPLDGRTAVSNICALWLDQISQTDFADSVSNPIEAWKKAERKSLEEYDMEPEAIEKLLLAVVSDDYSDFKSTFELAWQTRSAE